MTRGTLKRFLAPVCWLRLRPASVAVSTGIIGALLAAGCAQQLGEPVLPRERQTASEAAAAQPANVQSAGQDEKTPGEAQDREHWQKSEAQSALEAYQEYLFQHPAGAHAAEAKKRIDDMFADVERSGVADGEGRVSFEGKMGESAALLVSIRTKEGGTRLLQCPLVFQDDGVSLTRTNGKFSGRTVPVPFHKGCPFVCGSIQIDNDKMFVKPVHIVIRNVESDLFFPSEATEVPVRAALGLNKVERWVCAIGVVWHFVGKDVPIRVGSNWYVTQEPASSLEFTKYGVVIDNMRRTEHAAPLRERADASEKAALNIVSAGSVTYRSIRPKAAEAKETHSDETPGASKHKSTRRNHRPIKLMAIVARDGMPTAWLRSGDRTIVVGEGDAFDLDEFEGTMTRIQDREIEVRDSDGKRFRVSLGGTLQENTEHSARAVPAKEGKEEMQKEIIGSFSEPTTVFEQDSAGSDFAAFKVNLERSLFVESENATNIHKVVMRIENLSSNKRRVRLGPCLLVDKDAKRYPGSFWVGPVQVFGGPLGTQEMFLSGQEERNVSIEVEPGKTADRVYMRVRIPANVTPSGFLVTFEGKGKTTIKAKY